MTDQARWQQALADFGADRFAPAARALQAIIERHPQALEPRELLALSLLKQRQADAAIAGIEAALALGLESASLHNSLSLAHSAERRYDAAAEAARKACALAPDQAELQANLGNALKNAGQVDAALAAYQRALQLKPGLDAARVSLGSTQAALGQTAAALASYHQALEHDPNHALAFYHLALSAKGDQDGLAESLIARFQQRAAAGDVPAAERVLLENALGHLAERAGRFDRAFAHYDASNQLAKAQASAAGRSFDQQQHSRLVDRLIDLPPPPSGTHGDPSPRPLFIVGLPRSGTTLVEQLLSGHSGVAAGGERLELPLMAEAIENYPDGLLTLGDDERNCLAADYRAALQARAPGARWASDKLPENFLHLGLIARLWPEAAVIHCRRDLRDTGFSCFAQNFARDQAFANDLRDIAAYARDYRRLMAHWRDSLPLTLLEVDYEALIENSEAEARRLVAGLDLAWEPACLDFETAANPVLTASQWQVRQKLNTRSIGRWRRFEAHLGPLLDSLDPPPD